MSFLRRLFRSAPIDPGVPLAQALELAQALKELPEMSRDPYKDHALMGLIGNLREAASALERGRDEEGIPISKGEIADRLRRTHGYVKHHGIWARLLQGAGKEARVALRQLDAAIDKTDKALRAEDDRLLRRSRRGA